jgi:hypothetical protein
VTDAPETSSARARARIALAGLRDKMAVAITGFILTGVIGTMVTTWIQQRGWAWQNRVSKIEKDTENALNAYKSASELVNLRWHATYRMVRALERKASGDEWKGAREGFAAADRDWGLRYTNVAREIEFYVDTPFGIDPNAKLGAVWNLTCTDYALKNFGANGVDARSARAIIEIVNHCQGRVKNAIDAICDAATDVTAAAPPVEKPFIDTIYAQLDHLYRTNEALRCTIFERALTMRRAVTEESYWGTFFGVAQPSYVIPPDARDCSG